MAALAWYQDDKKLKAKDKEMRIMLIKLASAVVVTSTL